MVRITYGKLCGTVLSGFHLRQGQSSFKYISEIEGIAKSLAHIDICEEITGDTVSIKFTAADQIFVTLNGNGKTEEKHRVR